MTESTCFRIKGSNIIHETIDRETVIVNLDSGNYYSLENTGARVWSSIEKEASLRQMIEDISFHYNAGGEEIKKALSKLLTLLRGEGLIAFFEREEPGPGPVSPEGDRIDGGAERKPFEVPVLHKYNDMQELLLLDPIHEVDETGWPNVKPEQDA